MMQQRRAAEETATPGRRIAELRQACESEIKAQSERALLAAGAFRHSLQSIRSLAQETLANREKLVGLRESLKELEVDMEETLAVKTGKEAKSTAMIESVSTTIARTEQVKKIILDQRRRRAEYAAIISEHSDALEALEEKSNQQLYERKNIEEAIAWYRRILGFQAEGGEGVKFIFSKVDLRNPDAEFSFSVRLDNDVYKLLHADPSLEGITELVQDLNKTNDLFRFVRIMREKFQVAALDGVSPATISVHPDFTSVTISSPPPVSVDSISETSVQQDDLNLKPRNHQLDISKKVKSSPYAISTPKSLSTLRRSPRFRVKKST